MIVISLWRKYSEKFANSSRIREDLNPRIMTVSFHFRC